MKFHHFDVTKDNETYRIVIEGEHAQAVKEMQSTFGFDTVSFVSATDFPNKNWRGNKKIGRCIVRAFWAKSRREAVKHAQPR